MKRLAALIGLLLTVALPLPAFAQAAPCQFVLGFATMAAVVPQIGSCKEDQHYASNGDAQQATTGGLLVWRKADNWTAFTDGYQTWLNGPNGIQQRLNTDRFPWEGTPVSQPIGPTCAAAPSPFDGLSACNLNGGVSESAGSTEYRDTTGTVVFRWTHDDFVQAFYQQGHGIDPSGTPTSGTVGCQIASGGTQKFVWRCTYDPAVAAAKLGLPASSGGPDLVLWQKPSGGLLASHYPVRKATCLTDDGVRFLAIALPAGCVPATS